MIKSLEIKNFKSIKELKLDCKRINIFLGEPNTGKSNILESLGVLSFGRWGENIKYFIRLEHMSNLFYDENLDESISIKFDDNIFEIKFENSRFKGFYYREGEGERSIFDYNYDGVGSRSYLEASSPFKFYRFIIKEHFPRKETDFLLPPYGENLLAVLLTHPELKDAANKIFEPSKLKLVYKPQEGKIEILKQYNDTFISYPYSLTSDTLQRIVFYFTAIDSNKDSIIILEEPEAHAFPYYTKFLAERIALDQNKNQYFISTHNPYFLLAILEKAPKDEIGVFITFFEDYQTKIKPLSDKSKEEIMGMGADVFFNIEKFLEEENK